WSSGKEQDPVQPVSADSLNQSTIQPVRRKDTPNASAGKSRACRKCRRHRGELPLNRKGAPNGSPAEIIPPSKAGGHHGPQPLNRKDAATVTANRNAPVTTFDTTRRDSPPCGKRNLTICSGKVVHPVRVELTTF